MKTDTKDIEKIMDDLITGGSNVLVASPETIQQLKDKGLPIKETFVSYEEYLQKLVVERQKEALARLKRLPKIDSSIADAVINEIYEEIRSSYALGFFTSSIANSIFLLEYSMRSALFTVRIKNDPKYEWIKLENMTMKKLIAQLKKASVLNESDSKMLINFNDTLRDPYLHINIRKLSEEIVISELPSVNVATGVINIMRDVKASEHRFLWFSAKRFFDKSTVDQVINFCISWTNKLLIER